MIISCSYRYSRKHAEPTIDSQQDFCVIQTNVSDRNVYAAFERFIRTGDPNDISFTPNLFLTFAMGLYTVSTTTNIITAQHHFFRVAYQTSISLINCTASKSIILLLYLKNMIFKT